MKVGFAGLSHLGLVYSLATASKGFEVRGWEPDPVLVAKLGKGEFPVHEPGLRELWRENGSRISWHDQPGCLAECGLVFFSLDVVTDPRDRSDTRPLETMIAEVVPRLRSGTAVVLLSQVDPGFTRTKLLSLARKAGLRAFYQVETLVFGRAVERALKPERFMVGAEDPSHSLPEPLQTWHESFGAPVLVMGLESAELCKIAINFFLVSTICTTNTLAEAATLAGADWAEIAPALRLDARIGPHAYLNPGLGIGGGNLPRDMQTLQRLSGGKKTSLALVDAWLWSSRYHREWAIRAYKRLLQKAQINPRKARVAVWGLAYKENTASLKNSPALCFLEKAPAALKMVFDPAARLPKKIRNVRQVDGMIEACREADVLAILTPWSLFQQANPEEILQVMSRPLVLDPYRVFPPKRWIDLSAHLVTLGRN